MDLFYVPRLPYMLCCVDCQIHWRRRKLIGNARLLSFQCNFNEDISIHTKRYRHLLPSYFLSAEIIYEEGNKSVKVWQSHLSPVNCIKTKSDFFSHKKKAATLERRLKKEKRRAKRRKKLYSSRRPRGRTWFVLRQITIKHVFVLRVRFTT